MGPPLRACPALASLLPLPTFHQPLPPYSSRHPQPTPCLKVRIRPRPSTSSSSPSGRPPTPAWTDTPPAVQSRGGPPRRVSVVELARCAATSPNMARRARIADWTRSSASCQRAGGKSQSPTPDLHPMARRQFPSPDLHKLLRPCRHASGQNQRTCSASHQPRVQSITAPANRTRRPVCEPAADCHPGSGTKKTSSPQTAQTPQQPVLAASSLRATPWTASRT